MHSEVFDCGLGWRELLGCAALHAVSLAAVVLSSLPLWVTLPAGAGVLASLLRIFVAKRCRLMHDAAGWWVIDADGLAEGPWRLAPGSYLGRHVAVLRWCRDTRRDHCIICRHRVMPEQWRRLRVRLTLQI